MRRRRRRRSGRRQEVEEQDETIKELEFSTVTSIHYGKCGVSWQTSGCGLDFGFHWISSALALLYKPR